MDIKKILLTGSAVAAMAFVTACSDGAQAATAAHDYLSDTRSRSNIDTIPQSPNGDSSLSQREPK